MTTIRDGLLCQICHPPAKLRARLKVAWLIARGKPIPGTTVQIFEAYVPEAFSLHKKPAEQ